MNNDFGWSKLLCSFLSENTAFLILSAIIANFYSYLIGTYSKTISWLAPTYRLKKIIFRFISVPAKWIRTSRRWVLRLYTDKDYSPCWSREVPATRKSSPLPKPMDTVRASS